MKRFFCDFLQKPKYLFEIKMAIEFVLSEIDSEIEGGDNGILFINL